MVSDVNKALFDYWNKLVDKYSKPSRANVDPAEIPAKLLPHMFMTKIGENPFNVLIKLQGTFINGRLGQHLTGKYINEENFGIHHKDIADIYYRVVQQRVPIVTQEKITSPTGVQMTIEVLHLPVWGEDGKVSHVFGAIDILGNSADTEYEFLPKTWQLLKNGEAN